MRLVLGPLLSAIALVLGTAHPVLAACGDGSGDQAAVADARAQIAAQCDCAGARSHGSLAS